ncbi:MAG: GGDEF domain-containing protein [Gammaproteobacteria bacterium]|nr:MAG: GGDEF domain-containing protein [Gammaproteobacteria bacterium]
MAPEPDWRDRYLELAEQFESAEQHWQNAERELVRLVARLCIATGGLDAQLDPHLSRLRKATKQGATDALVEQAGELGDALLKAQDERVKGDLVARLLDRSALSSSRAKAALKLWQKLASAPGQASDAQLDQLADLLFGGRGAEGRSSGGGLLGRLLARSGREHPNRLLKELLGSIRWPAAAKERIARLQARLDGDVADDAWVEVVRQVGDMAAQALDRAHQDAEASSRFLAQLTERLEAIDQYMQGDSERRKASRESGIRLGKAVSSEVGGLSASMDEGGELAGLRRQVIDTLDRIQQHVTLHLQSEAERGLHAERQAALLQRQLEALQTETFELRRQVEESRQQAMRDPLTGLPNRRAFEARLDEELARWRRFGSPLALVVYDVDDFKQINDVFGHKAGDRALALIGRILSESLRETDFIARYGGEEFVALLPGADAEAALGVADMMRRQVEQAGMHSHNRPVKITLSGGVAVAGKGESGEQLFERADQAMYEAKQRGKNQCRLATPPAAVAGAVSG